MHELFHGDRGLGAIIKSSEQLVVLWDWSYAQRLWCIFEHPSSTCFWSSSSMFIFQSWPAILALLCWQYLLAPSWPDSNQLPHLFDTPPENRTPCRKVLLKWSPFWVKDHLRLGGFRSKSRITQMYRGDNNPSNIKLISSFCGLSFKFNVGGCDYWLLMLV